MADRYFDSHALDRLTSAIRTAEAASHGEIRVFWEPHCPGDPVQRAMHLFQRLNMHKTQHRSGVLIYVASESHCFSVIGDVGIHQRVQQPFWDQLCLAMKERFASSDPVGAIEFAIIQCGQELRKHFPITDSNPNELPDEVVNSVH